MLSLWQNNLRQKQGNEPSSSNLILLVPSKCKDLTKIINIITLIIHPVFRKVLEHKYLKIYKFKGLA